MPDSWTFESPMGWNGADITAAKGKITRETAKVFHDLAVRMAPTDTVVRGPQTTGVEFLQNGAPVDPDRVLASQFVLFKPAAGSLPRLAINVRVNEQHITAILPGMYHLSQYFGFDLDEFHDTRRMERRPMTLSAADVQVGDLVDLEGDQFAAGADKANVFECELQQVVHVERETDACVAIGFDGVDIIGFPVDHKMKVERPVFPEGALGPTLEEITTQKAEQRRPRMR